MLRPRLLPQPQTPIRQVLRPFQEFAQIEASGGILLLACTAVAIGAANSPWRDAYAGLWQTKVTVGLGEHALSKPLLLWINDGLMAIFFFVVGLEIKRELLIGELSSARRAALPIAAALGGMVVPATIYAGFNLGTGGARGWGIPMATDIAFVIGVMALLGSRVPLGLKVFLTALAIVDDIGAVLVIALFYTSQLSWPALAVGAVFFIGLIVANYEHARSPIPYALLGVGLWLAFLKSGVHTTIAGVLVAMTVPARARIDTGDFLQRSRRLLQDFEGGGRAGSFLSEEQQAAVLALEDSCEAIETPMQRLEHSLHPWVTFGIMPLFALANAGVAVGGNLPEVLTHQVSQGILLGLVLGKPVGITAFAWLAVRLRIAVLPRAVTWPLIYGAGWLGGIGFTMSLFVAGIAFDDERLAIAKLGILTASLVAGLGGLLILNAVSGQRRTLPLEASTSEL